MSGMTRSTKALIASAISAGVLLLAALGTLGVHYVDSRTKTDQKLIQIAQENHANGQEATQILQILAGATGPDAQAKSQAVLSGAIDQLRKSIDCVALYDMGDRAPACADVDARVDALAAGQDPFAPKGP